jgi:RHS repeat-associated protein
VSDYQGRVYEHIEYTPYGELWVEHGPEGLEAVPYRFTGKELDEETGLYYYGARYLNPRTSRWISADPGLEDYLPVAPVNDEARRRNRDLPGQGGVFVPVNLAVYHYSGNNPVRYVDPNGFERKDPYVELIKAGAFYQPFAEAFIRENVVAVAREFVGVGYKLGAKQNVALITGGGLLTSPRIAAEGEYWSVKAGAIVIEAGAVIDCSGLTQVALAIGAGIFIPEGSAAQRAELAVTAKPKVGDIMYLYPPPGGKYGHVAIISAVDKSGRPTMIIEASGELGRVVERRVPETYFERKHEYLNPYPYGE